MVKAHHSGKRRRIFTAAAAALFAAIGAIAPSGDLFAASEPLKIYVTPTPQGDVLRYVQKLADEDGTGLKLKVIESSQGLDANELVLKGDVDASLIQHGPYFDLWISAHPDAKGDLVNVATVLVNIFGLYSAKYKSAKDIPDGASILVPNDNTNLSRALRILQKEGLLKLDFTTPDGSAKAIAIDEKQILDNPKHFNFVPTDTGLRATSFPDVPATFINGDIALTHGIDPASGLSLEDARNNPYANVLTTRKSLANDPRIKLLVDYLTGEKVAKYIKDSYKGFIIPAQERLPVTQ